MTTSQAPFNNSDDRISPRPLAVVVASGGMDSCVAAAIAHQQFDLAMLHLNYGQRTEARELAAFQALADHFSARHRLIIDARFFQTIGGSSLTDPELEVPTEGISPGIPTTYVPFRNANILCMATAWAEVLGAGPIFIGVVEEDSSGYPDCREAFIDAFNRLITQGTRPNSRITIEAPLLHLTKADIVRRGIKLGAPLHLTWSCYQSEDRACGTCDSCRLRLQGFARAGHPDPIPYRE